MASENVFITGATGFLGGYIAALLVSEGYKVTALRRPGAVSDLSPETEAAITWLEGDLNDLPLPHTFLQETQYVVHAAALVSFQPGHSEALHHVNTEGTANLINACLPFAEPQGILKKFIHISSVAALGRIKNSLTITEEGKWEEDSVNSRYAETKYLAELEVWRAYNEGLPVAVLNPSLILGAGRPERSSNSLFKYAFEEHTYYTSGLANYTDVRDVAQATLSLLQSPVSGKRFIISAGAVSYSELFTQMAARFGKKPPKMLAGPAMASVAWRLERLRALFTGKPPVITEETARSSQNVFTYNGQAITKALPGFRYRSLAETLDWACAELKGKL